MKKMLKEWLAFFKQTGGKTSFKKGVSLITINPTKKFQYSTYDFQHIRLNVKIYHSIKYHEGEWRP